MIDRMKQVWAERFGVEERFDAEIAPDVVDVDSARDYDVDVGLFGDEMLCRAAVVGIPLRAHGTRTARLTVAELDTLGFGDLQRDLSEIANHQVKFVLVQDKRMARRLGLNVMMR